MNQTVSPGPRTGSVRIPASKSQAHRLLICAALGAQPVALRCDGVSADIAATARCLSALGADITDDGAGTLRIVPIAGEMPARADLFCCTPAAGCGPVPTRCRATCPRSTSPACSWRCRACRGRARSS